MSMIEELGISIDVEPFTFEEQTGCISRGYWRTGKGKHIKITDMETSHIFNVLRLEETKGLVIDLSKKVELLQELVFRLFSEMKWGV